MVKAIIKNLCFAVISIILSLFFAEFILYLSGKAYYAYRIKNEPSHLKVKNVIKILCLGDSNTFGMGAQKGYSYPEQLERMLNKNSLNKKFLVYNCGMPGNTSSKILDDLERNLDIYSPDIVIILIGANDAGQIQNSNFYIFKYKGFRKFIFRLEYYLYKFRVYKLFKAIWDSSRVRLWEARLIAKYGDKEVILTSLNKPRDPQSLIVDKKKYEEFQKHLKRATGFWNIRERQDSLAIEEGKKAMSIMPDNENVHLFFAGVYSGTSKFELAVKELEKAEKINPFNVAILDGLWQAYYFNGETKLAQETLEKYLYYSNPGALHKYLPLLEYGFPSLRDHEPIDKLLKLNFEKIINLVSSRKIKLVLQNYAHPNGKIVSELNKEMASRYKIPFVDNRQVFIRIASNQGYKESDYFAPDTHPNNKGYFIIAENVYNIMKDNNLLEWK